MVFGYSINKTIEKTNALSVVENNRDSINIPMMGLSEYPFEDPPNEIWNKTYGGDDTDQFSYFQPTTDKGYILAGSTSSFGHGRADIWMIKTDENGNEIWNKTYGDSNAQIGQCVKETNDGGYILVGSHEVTYESIDLCVIKTDNDGNEEWYRIFDKLDTWSIGNNVLVLDDGYLVMAQICFDKLFWKYFIWILKIDFSGNIIWDKIIGDINGNDHGNSIIETSDGDFLIVGQTFSLITRERVLLIKIDNEGNKIWRKEYNGVFGEDVIETDDKEYVIAAGQACSAYLLKTDNNGVLQWICRYFINGDLWPGSICQTDDYGFIIAGGTFSGVSSFDALLYKTDAEGNKLWEIRCGGKQSDSFDQVFFTDEGDFICAGTTESIPYPTYRPRFWLVKIASYDNERPIIPTNPEGPVKGKIDVPYTYTINAIDPDGDRIYFLWNWGDGTYNYWLGPYANGETCSISHTWTTKGSYTIQVKAMDMNGGESNWGTLTVTMPRNRAINNPFLKFLQSHPNLFPLLRQLLGGLYNE